MVLAIVSRLACERSPWEDFDWQHATVTIRRSAYRGAIDETKTTSSKAKLPLAPLLAELLLAWKAQSNSPWLFANPATEMPYMSPSLQQRWIRPAGEAIGIEGLGFHSLRHSYRSWLDATGAAPGVTKDLMRHSGIATTFNVYGKALSPEKREANNRVVEIAAVSRCKRSTLSVAVRWRLEPVSGTKLDGDGQHHRNPQMNDSFYCRPLRQKSAEPMWRIGGSRWSVH